MTVNKWLIIPIDQSRKHSDFGIYVSRIFFRVCFRASTCKICSNLLAFMDLKAIYPLHPTYLMTESSLSYSLN